MATKTNEIPKGIFDNDDNNIYVGCPKCESWEGMGIDDPRHHLNELPITEWLPDRVNKPERSIHECISCETTFMVVWDYDNNNE